MIQMEEEHRISESINSYGTSPINSSPTAPLDNMTLLEGSLHSVKLSSSFELKQQQQQQQQIYQSPVISITPETINSSSCSSSNLLVDINTPISVSPISNNSIVMNNDNNNDNNSNNSNIHLVLDSNSSTPSLLGSPISTSETTTNNNDIVYNENNHNNNNIVDIIIDNSNNNNNNNNNDNNLEDIEIKKDYPHLLNTPIEIINYIFLNVGALNLPSLLRVNKFCFRTGMKEGLWSLFVQNDFGIAVSDLAYLVRLNGGARSLYANLYFKRRNSIAPVRSPNPLVRFFLKPISKLPSLFTRKEFKILMYGLDGVGKTTLLYKFARGEFVRTLPTNGYNVEVVEYKSCDFICWDIGYNTNKPVVPVWHHYIQDTQALIFIIDSTDRTRLNLVREELWRMLTDRNVAKILSFKQNDNTDGRINRVKVLIYANKIDKLTSNPMNSLEITLALSLFNLPKHIVWHVQGCSATSEEGDGLYEGLDWLNSQFEE